MRRCESIRVSAYRSLWLMVVCLAAGSLVRAQSVTCSASATPLTVLAEGMTELVGDVVVTCTASASTTITISEQLNTNITSRLLNAPLSEALLLVDDPAPSNQVACSGATCNGSSSQQNVFQGTVAAGTVSFTLPLASGTHTLRLTNIRANATTLKPLGAPAAGGFHSPPGRIPRQTTVARPISASGLIC